MTRGDKVRTVKPDKESDDWTPEFLATRKWGVTGHILSESSQSGGPPFYYEVLHDDNSIGYYDPQELESIQPTDAVPPAAALVCDCLQSSSPCCDFLPHVLKVTITDVVGCRPATRRHTMSEATSLPPEPADAASPAAPACVCGHEKGLHYGRCQLPECHCLIYRPAPAGRGVAAGDAGDGAMSPAYAFEIVSNAAHNVGYVLVVVRQFSTMPMSAELRVAFDVLASAVESLAAEVAALREGRQP